MNFEILLEELLNELSGTEIYQKYYNKIPYDIFLNIVKSDPKSIIDEQGNPTILGKYAKLLISLYQKGGLQIEDLDKASEYLGYVYQHRISIDLGTYVILLEVLLFVILRIIVLFLYEQFLHIHPLFFEDVEVPVSVKYNLVKQFLQ